MQKDFPEHDTQKGSLTDAPSHPARQPDRARPLRRKDRAVTDETDLERIITANTVCTLGMVDGNEPALLPMNYGYAGRTFYLHAALEGRKLDVLRRNPNVEILITDSLEPISAPEACGHSLYYRSLICSGQAEILTGHEDCEDREAREVREEKRKALRIIMKQQTGREEWDIPDRQVDRVAVIRIPVTRMSGKQKAP